MCGTEEKSCFVTQLDWHEVRILTWQGGWKILNAQPLLQASCIASLHDFNALLDLLFECGNNMWKCYGNFWLWCNKRLASLQHFSVFFRWTHWKWKTCHEHDALASFPFFCTTPHHLLINKHTLLWHLTHWRLIQECQLVNHFNIQGIDSVCRCCCLCIHFRKSLVSDWQCANVQIFHVAHTTHMFTDALRLN